jgi:hypothetical protein
MSLPTERWSISIDEQTKFVDAQLALKLAPYAPTKSARVRFALALAYKVICEDCTLATLQSVTDAVLRLNGITSSYAFPAQPPQQAGEENGAAKSRTGAPLEFRVSRPFRAAWVREADTEAYTPAFLRRSYAMGSVA